jgi:hypothetical protein
MCTLQRQNQVAQASTGTCHQSVDDIVHNQLYYAKICEEQSAIFRQHVEEFTKEYASTRNRLMLQGPITNGNHRPKIEVHISKKWRGGAGLCHIPWPSEFPEAEAEGSP